MHEDIKRFLNDGVLAPSGENCQPWRFEVRDNSVSIFNVPEADQSLYNSKQKGSYMAHGALIENIVLSASSSGYLSTITLFPDSHNKNHTASIVFEKSDVQEDKLVHQIKERSTNRKSFTGEKLNDTEKQELLSSITSPLNELILVDDEDLRESLGTALAVNEQVLFENKKIHDFFYCHLIWDKKDEDKAGGFFIDTLEFLPHQLGAVKLFKNWTILSLLNRIVGVSKKIAKENGEKYSASGTFGAITMRQGDREAWIQAGRSMERVWLVATSLGLAFHPCNGTIYFMEHIQDNGDKEFSKKHSTLIRSAYEVITNSFGSKDNHIAFIFRIGKADAPSTRAKRLEPMIEFT